MTHFFEKRDRWGNGAALWVLVGMIFLIPLALWSIERIDLENDVANWLPAGDPNARSLAWFKEHFGTSDQIIVSWRGSSLVDPRIPEFQTRLLGRVGNDGTRRNGVEFIDTVVTPLDVIERMSALGVERDTAVERLQGILVGRGALKIQLTEAGRNQKQQTIETLLSLARSRFGLKLSVQDSAETALDEFDEEGEEYDEADEEWDEEDEVVADADQSSTENASPLYVEREHDFQLTWSGIQRDEQPIKEIQNLLSQLRGRETRAEPRGEALVADSFFTIGSPVGVMVGLSPAGRADTDEALLAIRRVAADIGIAEESLHLGGRAVAGEELDTAVKQAAWDRSHSIMNLPRRSVVLSSILVAIGLAFVMLKSFRLATFVLIAAVYSTFLAVAIVPLTNGSMNMVLVVMPALLAVLAVSGGIHVANYFKHAVRNDPATAVVETVRMAKKPCVLAGVTTAIGLASLMTSPLVPVRDFGMYSAAGCLISLVIVLYGLPALLQFWPLRAATIDQVHRSDWRRYANVLVNCRALVIVASIVLFGGGAWGLQEFQTETKVIRYFPEQSTVVGDYRFLEDHLLGIVPVETIVRFDETARQQSPFLQRMELVREIGDNMRLHPEISGTVSLADFQPVSQPPGEGASFPQKARYFKRSHIIETRVKDGNENSSSAFLAVAKTDADLHADGDNKLSREGDELWRITAQVSIMSDADYGKITTDLDEIAQSTLKYHAGAAHVVTGMVPVFLRTQQAVLDSLIVSFVLAFVTIGLVLAYLLKSPLCSLLTMFPNVLPVGVVFGLISWNGLSVDIGTMITASVALGIAVDGTLHLITWFQVGIREGKSRRDAVADALARCGPAMWQTGTTVALGLLVLSMADLLLVSRFGWMMASLVGMALVADLVFLPALLAGPLGALIEKTISAQDVAPAEVSRRPVAAPHIGATPATFPHTLHTE